MFTIIKESIGPASKTMGFFQREIQAMNLDFQKKYFRSKVGILMGLALIVVGTASYGQALQDPIPAPIPQSNIRIKLDTVATGLTAPNWGTLG